MSAHRWNVPAITLALSLVVGCFAGPAAAGEAFNVSRGGIVLQGYDVVAYFEDGKAIQGKRTFEAQWAGVTWRFATEAHLDTFLDEPERYVPQYGGFCAWAMSRGDVARVNPRTAWAIVNDKLYLNFNPAIHKRWEEQQLHLIQSADHLWPAVREQLVTGEPR